MSTPTLDEIEALAWAHAETATLPGGYVQMDVLRLSDALLGLVAHVRALHVMTAGIDAMQGSHGVGIQNAAERITALEAKVAALAGPVIPVDLSEIHAELDRLRAENADLRKRLEAGTWPAPQPIETAPLSTTVLTWDVKNDAWSPHFTRLGPPAVTDRARYTHWLPMPPPPGGGK